MSNYYQVVQNVDDLKRICPNINFDNYQFVSMPDDGQFGGAQQVCL